jgi:Holliday junction resolvase RusA-like endonuclease
MSHEIDAAAWQWAFFVPGKPQPKRRPRFGGGHVRTDKRTKAFEQGVSIAAHQAMGGRSLAIPVAVSVEALFARPKTRPDRVPVDWWRTDGRVPRPSTPDADNILKAILDGLQLALPTSAGTLGPALADDSWVTELSCRTMYAGTADQVGCLVRVRACGWLSPHGPATAGPSGAAEAVRGARPVAARGAGRGRAAKPGRRRG